MVASLLSAVVIIRRVFNRPFDGSFGGCQRLDILKEQNEINKREREKKNTIDKERREGSEIVNTNRKIKWRGGRRKRHIVKANKTSTLSFQLLSVVLIKETPCLRCRSNSPSPDAYYARKRTKHARPFLKYLSRFEKQLASVNWLARDSNWLFLHATRPKRVSKNDWLGFPQVSCGLRANHS